MGACGIDNLKHVAEQLFVGGGVVLAMVWITLYLKSRATR